MNKNILLLFSCVCLLWLEGCSVNQQLSSVAREPDTTLNLHSIVAQQVQVIHLVKGDIKNGYSKKDNNFPLNFSFNDDGEARQLKGNEGFQPNKTHIENINEDIENSRRAINLKRDDLEAWNKLGSSLLSIGELNQAISVYEEILLLNQRHSDNQEMADTYSNLGLSHKNRGDFEQAIYFYQKSLQTHKVLGDKDGMASDNLMLGNTNQDRGNFERAIDCYQEALANFEILDFKLGKAIALEKLGYTYQTKGDSIKSTEFYQKALLLSQELDDKKGMADDYLGLAISYRTRDDFKNAIESYQKALQTYETLVDKAGIEAVYFNLIQIYKSRGNLSKAIEMENKTIEMLQKTLHLHKALDNKAEMANDYNRLAKAYRNNFTNTFHLDKVIEFFQKALQIHEALGNKVEMAIDYRSLADAYIINDYDLDKAIENFQKALKIHEVLGNKVEMAADYEWLAKAYFFNKGDFDKAVEFLQKEQQVYEDLGNIKKAAENLSQLGVFNALHSYFETRFFYYIPSEDLTNGIAYSQKALTLYEVLNDKLRISDLNFILGYYYLLGYCNGGWPFYLFRDSDNLNKSIDSLQKSIKMLRKDVDDLAAAYRYYLLGITYYYMENKPESKRCLLMSISLYKKLSRNQDVQTVQTLMDSLE